MPEVDTSIIDVQHQYDVLRKRLVLLTAKERSDVLKYIAGYMEADKNEMFLRATNQAIAMFGKELET
jgi:hypothetical protein